MIPKLENLTLQQYTSLTNDDILTCWYPEATGIADKDLQAVHISTNITCDFEKSPFIITTHFYDILDSEASYAN